MAPGFPTSRLLRESAPVAVVLLFWVLLSSLLPDVVTDAVLLAGVVMALLLVVVRGVALAAALPTVPAPDDTGAVLRENVGVALGAGVWFLAALVVYAAEGLWNLLGIPGAFTTPAPGLAFVFSATGVATVVLYAVAVGLPRVRRATDGGGSHGAGRDQDVAPVDD